MERFKSFGIHYKGMKINPTTKFTEEEEEEYTLEDKDFLLITALNNLANEIQKMRLSNGRR